MRAGLRRGPARLGRAAGLTGRSVRSYSSVRPGSGRRAGAGPRRVLDNERHDPDRHVGYRASRRGAASSGRHRGTSDYGGRPKRCAAGPIRWCRLTRRGASARSPGTGGREAHRRPGADGRLQEHDRRHDQQHRSDLILRGGRGQPVMRPRLRDAPLRPELINRTTRPRVRWTGACKIVGLELKKVNAGSKIGATLAVDVDVLDLPPWPTTPFGARPLAASSSIGYRTRSRRRSSRASWAGRRRPRAPREGRRSTAPLRARREARSGPRGPISPLRGISRLTLRVDRR